MNWDTYFTLRIVEDLGWTLLHSLWQIGIVSGILLLVLRILRNRSANLRYSASVLALAFSVILPVITFIQISATTSAEQFAERSSEQIAREQAIGNELPSRGQTLGEGSGGPHQIVIGSGTSAMFSGVREYLSRHIPGVLPFAVGLWLVGVGLFSFRLAGGIWQLRRYKTQGVETVDEHWCEKFSRLCDDLAIFKQIRLLKSTIVETPIAIGFFKPLILIPASLFLQISPRELETIIAHELIHIRRYDPLVNILQNAVEVMFFYHPGVWWMSEQIRREREFAADAAVMEIFEDSHVVYASALANLEEIRLRANQQTPRYATAANGGNLMQRIQKILKINTEMNRANSAWSAGLAFVLISAVLTMVFSFNSSSFVNGQNKTSNRKIAIGFVSIPPLDRTDNPPKDSDATARILIEKLKSHKIPAIGFVQGGLISDGDKLFPVRANIVRLWRDAGFEIGIGGFKHIWFSRTSYDDYVANVVKNETVVKKILDEKNQQIRYYSYPFLNTGGNQEDRARFESWLKERNYRFIPYTFDNDEWLYSFAYDAARNDNDLNTMQSVRDEFLDYMQKMLTHYEEYSHDMFQRDIAQTLVLTPSRLVADSSDDLFGMFEKRGYAFVSMDDALADEAYKTDGSLVIRNSGISWFKRWASKQGKRLREEPEVSEEVARIWKKAEAKK